MKVIATKRGYLGKLREVGEEFDVPEGSTGSWFQPVVHPAGVGQKLPAPKAGTKSVDDLV